MTPTQLQGAVLPAPTEKADLAPVPVCVARGDGIGPEITGAVLRVLEAAGARLDVTEVEIGERVYRRGLSAGIEPETWDVLRRSRAFLKGPITTPQGGGFKSLNVTARKSLGLYANIRPNVAYAPFVPTRHPGMDVVIVRENEEDTYAGIEHRQTAEVVQCLKLISRPGCERIIRYAFEYARAHGRRKVTCMTKDNIMKATDGLFHSVFREMAAEYPDLESEHMIIDIGAARLADQPDRFDVIVTLNLYGDILSDVAAQLAGSVGLAGSANVGEHGAMFEAIHGSAPDIAGMGVANPSGMLLAAVQMLVHVGRPTAAEQIHNAWLCAIEGGVRTADIAPTGPSELPVGTEAFTDAVIERLGSHPQRLAPVHYESAPRVDASHAADASRLVPVPALKTLDGVDVFVDWDDRDRNPDVLARRLQQSAGPALRLSMITNRGVKVWPEGLPETFRTDHWRCRFMLNEPESEATTTAEIVALLGRLHAAGVDFVKTEHLYRFDGEPGYSRGQGE